MSNLNAPAQEATTYTASRYLRWTGTLILVLAMADFMVQGLDDRIPDYRYWIMGGFSVLLALCGLVCGYLWRETTGARLFFGLATACVPVHVSQAAALLLSHLESEIPGYAGWWIYEVLPRYVLGLNLLFTVTVLLPISFTGFSILGRRHRKILTGALVLGCLFVLAPVRTAPFSPLLLAALFAFLRYLDRRYLRHDETMSVAEGWAARLLLWIPFLVMLGRSVFYPWSFIESTVVLALSSLALLSDVPSLISSQRGRSACQATGAALGTMAWLCLSDGLMSQWPLPGALYSLSAYLPIAAFLFALPEIHDLAGRGYRTSGSLIALAVVMANLFNEPGYLSAVASMLTGLALGLGGVRYQERVPLGAGLLCLCSGITYYLSFIITVYHKSPWLTLVAIGVGILLLASYIETQHKRFWIKGRYYLYQLRSWH